jgi:hypothetical protein
MFTIRCPSNHFFNGPIESLAWKQRRTVSRTGQQVAPGAQENPLTILATGALYRFKTHRRMSDLRIHEMSYAVSGPQGLRPRARADLIIHPTWYPT